MPAIGGGSIDCNVVECGDILDFLSVYNECLLGEGLDHDYCETKANVFSNLVLTNSERQFLQENEIVLNGIHSFLESNNYSNEATESAEEFMGFIFSNDTQTLIIPNATEDEIFCLIESIDMTWSCCYDGNTFCSEEDSAKLILKNQLGLNNDEAFWLFDSTNSDVYNSVQQILDDFGDDELTNSLLNLIVQTHVYEGDLSLIDFEKLIQKIKDAVFEGITSAAVVMRNIYRILDQWAQNHPGVIDWINNDIDFIAEGLIDDPLIHIDLEEENISWMDLLVIWFFELKDLPEVYHNQFEKNYPTIYFTEGDLVIEGNTDVQSIKNLEGVNEAKQIAHNNIDNGVLQIPPQTWDFSEPQYWEVVTEGNAATFFLGSYTTNITIVDVGNGEYVLNFKIVNKTGWESGTRLIPDEDGDGVNESIIPDKPRGEDLHLGGTIVDIFEWSEIYTP